MLKTIYLKEISLVGKIKIFNSRKVMFRLNKAATVRVNKINNQQLITF